MERNTDISKILFPVELRPVNYTVAGSETAASAEGGEPASKNEEIKSINQYKAVVRGDTGTVFAVVSNRYELLHNSRALDLGKKAFVHLFPETFADDFIVYDIQLTKTGSACHIDLIHNSYSTDVWEQETWLPFLRVSNSYNRYRALSFDFGFVRKLCSNGVIFRKETIRARFYHTKGRLEVDLKQDKTFQKLKELEKEFAAHMKKLRDMTIDGQLLLPLSLYLLQLKFDLEAKDVKKRKLEQARLGEVVQTLGGLIQKYLKELGQNAYTALNAATDFATHSCGKAGPFANSAHLQATIAARSRDLMAQLEAEDRKPIDALLVEQVALASWLHGRRTWRLMPVVVPGGRVLPAYFVRRGQVYVVTPDEPEFAGRIFERFQAREVSIHKSPAASLLGSLKKGCKEIASSAKQRAARANGLKGGRPRRQSGDRVTHVSR